MRIIRALIIDDRILIIYYTSAKCYQFLIAGKRGKMYTFDSIFYSAEGAEEQGRLTIKTVAF